MSTFELKNTMNPNFRDFIAAKTCSKKDHSYHTHSPNLVSPSSTSANITNNYNLKLKNQSEYIDENDYDEDNVQRTSIVIPENKVTFEKYNNNSFTNGTFLPSVLIHETTNNYNDHESNIERSEQAGQNENSSGKSTKAISETRMDSLMVYVRNSRLREKRDSKIEKLSNDTLVKNISESKLNSSDVRNLQQKEFNESTEKTNAPVRVKNEIKKNESLQVSQITKEQSQTSSPTTIQTKNEKLNEQKKLGGLENFQNDERFIELQHKFSLNKTSDNEYISDELKREFQELYKKYKKDMDTSNGFGDDLVGIFNRHIEDNNNSTTELPDNKYFLETPRLPIFTEELNNEENNEEFRNHPEHFSTNLEEADNHPSKAPNIDFHDGLERPDDISPERIWNRIHRTNQNDFSPPEVIGDTESIIMDEEGTVSLQEYRNSNNYKIIPDHIIDTTASKDIITSHSHDFPKAEALVQEPSTDQDLPPIEHFRNPEEVDYQDVRSSSQNRKLWNSNPLPNRIMSLRSPSNIVEAPTEEDKLSVEEKEISTTLPSMYSEEIIPPIPNHWPGTGKIPSYYQSSYTDNESSSKEGANSVKPPQRFPFHLKDELRKTIKTDSIHTRPHELSEGKNSSSRMQNKISQKLDGTYLIQKRVKERISFVTVRPDTKWNFWGGFTNHRRVDPFFEPTISGTVNSSNDMTQVYSVYWGNMRPSPLNDGAWVIRSGSVLALVALVMTIATQAAQQQNSSSKRMGRCWGHHDQKALLTINLATSLAAAHMLLLFGIQVSKKLKYFVL